MNNVQQEEYTDTKTGKFKPGNPGGGRPKGATEKTKMWSRLGEYITQEGAERYMNILQGMGDDEFIKRFEMILEYFQPKQSRVEAKVESTHTNITISAPTPKRALGEGQQMISIPESIQADVVTEAEVIPVESSRETHSNE